MLSNLLDNAIKIGVTIIALCGGFTGCSDSDGTVPITALPHRTPVSASAVQQRALLHQRNHYDWVGISHNKALDLFRRELRKPTRMPPLCSFLLELATSQQHIPVEKRESVSQEERARTVSDLRARICDVKRAATAHPASWAGNPPMEVSSLALSLVARISAATTEATSSYDLSARLMPILAEASSLNEAEQALVLGTLSTAQNSMEYWESVWPQFMLEVRNEYAACLTTTLDEGASLEGSEATCLEPMAGPALRPTMLRLASIAEIPCGSNGAWEGIKATTQADTDAFGGGFIGGLVTKTVSGAVQVGAAAAVGKSGWQGVKVTIRLWKCAMGWTEGTGLS